MNTVEEYFDRVHQLVQDLPDAQTERYEEHILSATRGNLRIRLRFSDNALLEISEAFVIVGGELRWLSYRYHYQDSSAALVFRYDNAPHHPEIVTRPDHKHSGEQILASAHPSIEQLLAEVRAFRATGS
jgi:Family of unknown function (DUF6516)